GQVQQLLVTQSTLWRRLVLQSPEFAAAQTMDDNFTRYAVAIDQAKNSITLTERGSKDPAATFHFERPSTGQLILDGVLSGRPVHVKLNLLDREKLLLVSRGFHWVQEYPFNR